jgi:peptidoglycan/xylan/chitin deacetylase (PgdA/CDA1 family)
MQCQLMGMHLFESHPTISRNATDLRNLARSLAIRAAGLVRADALCLHSPNLKFATQVVVIAMHETPASLESHLRAQLEWASQHFRIGSLQDLADLWTQKAAFKPAPSKPLLLFTFDDGRESNYKVAAPLLESFGGRGVFFIVPSFAESAGSARSLKFYMDRIHPDCSAGAEATEVWKPMNPVQIADLASRGHAIGNHTLTHRALVELSDTELEREIGGSARQLSSWTGKPVDAFAWAFGWDAIDKSAWDVARRYHRFCFSPCAGAIHAERDHPSLLWRREIEPRYSAAEYRFAYSGIVDLLWAGRRSRLRNMLEARAEA